MGSLSAAKIPPTTSGEVHIMPALVIKPIGAAGHLMPYEQPGQVAQAIVQFAATQA